MEIELQTTIKVDVKFLEVSAGVRYWEDSTVNGVEDDDGKLIPLRAGSYWAPIIDLATGTIQNWPSGVTAEVHYKVCDDGEYWLQDADGKRIAKWKGSYVPDEVLCPGANGYGDYIILSINAEGSIIGWLPSIDPDRWEPA